MSEPSKEAMAAYDAIFVYYSNFIRLGGKISREEGSQIIDAEFARLQNYANTLQTYVNYVSQQISGEHIPLYLTEWKAKQEKNQGGE